MSYIPLIKALHYDPVVLQKIAGDEIALMRYFDQLDSEVDVDNIMMLRLRKLYGYDKLYWEEQDREWGLLWQNI